ncbi:unnamed protein product [Protopolystoma xenopodis]|uniref:Ribosomal protein S21 n=1 Tax=Protopolystoma xenopodis TaxID=117903 RepID=A0A3S5ARS6_9PLAT|nr:unnamed protein product [Protopolystoma xenopodis]
MVSKLISRVLVRDKVASDITRRERFEKPKRWRRRFMYERCKRIYDCEMARKIDMITPLYRKEPWPR